MKRQVGKKVKNSVVGEGIVEEVKDDKVGEGVVEEVKDVEGGVGGSGEVGDSVGVDGKDSGSSLCSKEGGVCQVVKGWFVGKRRRGVFRVLSYVLVGVLGFGLASFYSGSLFGGPLFHATGALGYVQGPGGVRVITQDNIFSPVEVGGRTSEVVFGEATRIVIDMEMDRVGIPVSTEEQRLAFVKEQYGEDTTLSQAISAMGIGDERGADAIDFLVRFEEFKRLNVGEVPVLPPVLASLEGTVGVGASVDASKVAEARERFSGEMAEYDALVGEFLLGILGEYELYLFALD